MKRLIKTENLPAIIPSIVVELKSRTIKRQEQTKRDWVRDKISLNDLESEIG